jgi:acetyl esterase/lipase
MCTVMVAFWLFVLLSVPLHAETITIPVSEIRQIVPGSGEPGTALNSYIARRLQELFNRSGFNTSNGLVFGDIPVDAYSSELATNCPIPLPKEARIDATTARITLDDRSSLKFDLDSIKTITVDANLAGRIDTHANAHVIWGQAIPFVGNCEKINTDNGTIDMALPFTMQLSLVIDLNARYDSQQVAIVVDKHAALSGQTVFGRGSISPEFGSVSLTEAVINIFEDYLLEKLTANGAQAFSRKVIELNNRFDGLDANGSPDSTIEAFNGETIFATETIDTDTARAVLQELGVSELLVSLLNDRGGEILLRLAVLNDTERQQFLAELGATLGCDTLQSNFERPLEQVSLYTLTGGQCISTDSSDTALSQYFSDPGCTDEIAFSPTPVETFCSQRLGPDANTWLGNAAAWDADTGQVNDPLPEFPSRPWTDILATRLDLGVASITDNQQPYMKQINYKTIENLDRGSGTCQLEMRIYKNDIAATGLKPLLAIHGGTWKNRGFSFLGLESELSHFTRQGFIVFAPFYRLVGDSDGNAECNNAAWDQVTDDIEDALQWVINNGAGLGAASQPVRLFGQSAGAHLALWLATHRRDDVDRTLVLYPPADVLDFLAGIQPGSDYDSFRDSGVPALARFYGAAIENSDLHLAAVDAASLDPANPPEDIDLVIPDSVFDLTALDPLNPPRYLARCAQTTATDLTLIDLVSPPLDLLACLKTDLLTFLTENAFYHQVSANPVPFFTLHGTADSVVPYAQSVKLCNAVAATENPVDFVGDSAIYQCDAQSQAHIITGVEHALDLGLCIGSSCPAGPPDSASRNIVNGSLVTGYTWLAEDSPAEPAPTTPVDSTPGSGNPASPGLDDEDDSQDADDETVDDIEEDEDGAGAIVFPAFLLLLGLFRQFRTRLIDRLPSGQAG